MAGGKDLSKLTVLLVGDDVVTAKLEASVKALGTDVERASASLATEVMQIAAPDLVVVSPNACAQCGVAVLEMVTRSVGTSVRAFLLCSPSRADQLGLVDAEGVVLVDPRLGANRVGQLVEEVLQLDNSAQGRQRMADLVAAAHGRKPAAAAVKSTSLGMPQAAPPAAAKAAHAAPLNEGTKPRFRMPTAAGIAPADLPVAAMAQAVPAKVTASAVALGATSTENAMTAKGAVSATSKVAAPIPKLAPKAPSMQGHGTDKHAGRVQDTAAGVFSAGPSQTRSAHEMASGATPKVATARVRAAAPAGPTPLSALLAGEGPDVVRRDPTPPPSNRKPASFSRTPMIPPALMASPGFMQAPSTDPHAAGDVLMLKHSSAEETTVVERAAARRSQLEHTHSLLGAMDVAERTGAKAEVEEFDISNHAVPPQAATARTAREAGVQFQPFAFAATLDAESSGNGGMDPIGEFAGGALPEPRTPQISPSMPVELASALESAPPQGFEPSAYPEQSSGRSSADVLPQGVSSSLGSVRGLAAMGEASGRKAWQGGSRWLRQQVSRARHPHLGKMGRSQLLASVGAMSVLVAVLWISVGGMQPAQTRALSSMEIAGTLRVSKEKPAVASAAEVAAAEQLADDATTESATADEVDGKGNSVAKAPPSEATLALLRDARGLIREGDGRLRDGRFGMAEAAYLKALRKIPRYPLALEGLTRVHLARKDGKEALRWAAILFNRQPIRSENSLLLGDAYALRGNMTAAKTAWQRAAKAGNKVAAQRLRARR